ncbi:MAG: pyruvate formate lyase family protein [Thermodesulfobacteriota bacterium]
MLFVNPPETTFAAKARTRSSLLAVNLVVRNLLRLMAANFALRPSLRKHLRSDQGFINFIIGIRTEDYGVQAAFRHKDGRVKVLSRIPDNPDAELVFRDPGQALALLGATPTQQIRMILQSDMRTAGNTGYVNLFSYLMSLLLIKKQRKLMEAERKERRESGAKLASKVEKPAETLARRRKEHLTAPAVDKGVKFLPDPYLSSLGLEDFPRLSRFLDHHFTKTPEICPELPRLSTLWHKANGFELTRDGGPWNPVTRKALSYKYILENKKPLIAKDCLVAGTTTTKDIGVVVYPEGHGTMIWGELLTVPDRLLNPYGVSEETRDLLHREVFPFWVSRNFREWVRQKYRNPLCQQLDERFAVYFDWKAVTISHTIPDFPKLLSRGALGIIADCRKEMKKKENDAEKNAVLSAMILCLEGLCAYAANLAAEADRLADGEADPKRRIELLKLARICRRVPEKPARTLDEAVNAIWIAWVALHMESTNAGLSLGRLDQWLQPYFAADAEQIRDEKKRADYVRHAVELVGHFFMRCTDHLPLTPDLANFYFGGSSSDQAITLGGVTPEGEDGVSDMTYIFLKVTEMLCLRDPNVNARFCPGKNSDAYLKRLCEVNLSTAATPSLHNDLAMKRSLAEFGYPEEDVNNWSATGCVEPTLSGKHIGHTNFQMMNMVAALEMALHNGRHPLMDWKVGPDTGLPENGDFPDFDSFFKAFTGQFAFLIDQSVMYNAMLAEAHKAIRPTPLLSSLISDCMEKGRDVTSGGARFNSSGAALIGLADVTDSLSAIKKLVYDEKKVDFARLKKAVEQNFQNDPALLALVQKSVPLFGSGAAEAVTMANRVAKFAHDHYKAKPHHRGGSYTVGFWSMSNHVVFGNLTGALPSGRLAGKPFTPGLTPQPHASRSLLDNLRDVAALDLANITNNIAFNVKVVPGPGEPRLKTVDTMASYAKAYFDLGGMQMQLNVVNAETLRDAMAHPESYRNLLVRISGYNAYFTTLNRDMQMELIERAEYGI